MTPIASGAYRPTSATSQELANLLARFAESARIDTKDVRISVSYVYEDGGRDVTGVDPLDFAGLIALAPPISLISLKSLQPQTSGLSLYVHADRIDLEAGGESLSAAQALVQKAAACLALKPYVPPSEGRSESLERRLDALQALQEERVRLQCAFFYRPLGTDTAAVAQVERFLASQGVEVVSPGSYEPRGVDDEAGSLSLAAADFALFLVNSAVDLACFVNEITKARVAGLAVIPLVEAGAQLEPGIFGQVDAIPFAEDHIGDVWVGLSEALAHLRLARRRHVRQSPVDAHEDS